MRKTKVPFNELQGKKHRIKVLFPLKSRSSYFGFWKEYLAGELASLLLAEETGQLLPSHPWPGLEQIFAPLALQEAHHLPSMPFFLQGCELLFLSSRKNF